MSETVRAFDGVNSESNKYEMVQSRALGLEEVQAWAYGSHKFVSDTLQSGLQGMLLFMCWNIGKSGGLPLNKLTSFMFYVNFVLESSNEVGDQWAKGTVDLNKFLSTYYSIIHLIFNFLILTSCDSTKCHWCFH